jgi:hypothetical protein
MSEMPELSIIIVNWNTRDLLDECIASVYSTIKSTSFDVWVVDNASSDGSVEMVEAKYPQANLIRNERNEGFGRANNRAIKASEAACILLLNSDIVLTENTIDEAYRVFLKHPEFGALGCALVGSDGKVQESFSDRIPHGPSVCTEAPEGLISSAYVWAACMFLRRSVIDRVGMFDEDFMVFHEDTDLCWRMLDAGFKIAYAPKLRILHGCRQSVKRLSRETYLTWLFSAEYTLFRKHHSRGMTLFQMCKRYVYYSIRLLGHQLAFAFSKSEHQQEMGQWFGTARRLLPVMLNPAGLSEGGEHEV